MERTFHMLLYRAFHAQRNYLRPCLSEIGLGSGQPKLLAYLSVHGPCRQKELADYFDVDPANVSRMLDSLEKGGFILRQTDGSSRRCDQVVLTDRGHQAQEAWQSRCAELETRMLNGFSEEERTQFASFLSRAYQNLRQEGDTPCGT